MEERIDFKVHSKIVAEKFLQTVVAVDDELVFRKRPLNVEPNAITDDELAGFEGENEEHSGLNVDEQPENPIAKASNDSDHLLYYQDLSVAFSNKGIVCSGIKPLETLEKSAKTVFESSKNSDITILDWQMDEGWEDPDGSLAIDSIKRILKLDIEEGGRLRLIVIYTAMPDLSGIAQQICDAVPVEYKCRRSEESLSFGDDNGKLRHCSIEVMEKQVRETDLSEKVVEVFSGLTSGLLSNAALASISDLREKTHNILHKFNKSLDPAYLSHVLGLISSPDMRDQAHDVAFDYATDLISEEFKSSMQLSSDLKHSLNKDALSSWVTHVSRDEGEDFFQLNLGDGGPLTFGHEIMSRLLVSKDSDELMQVVAELGVEATDGSAVLDRFEREPIHISLGDEETDSHEELSAIECLRRDLYSVNEFMPTLKQGSILQHSKTKDYYVCIQPLCESIRLTNDTNFAFLRMVKAGDGESFSYVVRDWRGSFVRLRVKSSANNLCSFRFNPDTEFGVVSAVQDRNGISVTCLPAGKGLAAVRLNWIAEFKHGVAQSISNIFASNISRVGLDSFEWLRQKSL